MIGNEVSVRPWSSGEGKLLGLVALGQVVCVLAGIATVKAGVALAEIPDQAAIDHGSSLQYIGDLRTVTAVAIMGVIAYALCIGRNAWTPRWCLTALWLAGLWQLLIEISLQAPAGVVVGLLLVVLTSPRFFAEESDQDFEGGGNLGPEY